MSTQLNKQDFLRFPLKIAAGGGVSSDRRQHVREQIEQILFTNPDERWFRPEFGIGVRALIFEPNNQSLADITSKRLTAALIDALKGEVVPQSLDVSVEPAGEKLVITIAYTLAAINHTEKLRFAEGGAL
jgi:hypothetical protein